MQKDSVVKIVITDLVVDVRIGLLDQEKEGGRSQRIIVNVEMIVDAKSYLKGVNAETIVDYAAVHDAIQAWSQNGHTELIETYLQDLLGLCFRYEKVQAARVSITKPDIFENADQVGVEVFMTRAEYESK